MALRWVEGFEAAGTNAELASKYENTSLNGRFEAGRHHGRSYGTVLGSASAAVDSRLRTPRLGDHSGWTVGLSVLISEPGTTSGAPPKLVSLQRAGQEQLYLEVVDAGDGDWTLGAFADGVELGRSRRVQRGVWHRVELKVLLSHDAGSAELRVDDGVEFAASGVRTSTLVHDLADQVQLQIDNDPVTTSLFAIDDVIIMDGTAETVELEGSTISTDGFIGDIVVEALHVDGAGSTTVWTPTGAPSNWECVDEEDADNADSDYVGASAAATVDEYATRGPTFATGPAVGVQLAVTVRLEAAGLRGLKHSVRSGGSRTADAGRDVQSTSYVDTFSVWAESPTTGKGWSASELEALEVGEELT